MGHETPTGEFTILQKKVAHRSNLYDDAPMPYMQRLTWDGIAIHAGHNPGYPASHGCIGVPLSFAKKLYALTQMGARVTVTDQEVVLPSATEPATQMAAVSSLPTAATPAPEQPAPLDVQQPVAEPSASVTATAGEMASF